MEKELKKYHKNSIKDLLEFRKESITDWNEANNKSAEEWNANVPKDKKGFEDYYKQSSHYIEAMATYNEIGKKLRLISKLIKIIEPLDIKTIVDFGCGVGSDCLWLAGLGYNVIGMDLPGIAFDFFLFRLQKYGKELKGDLKAVPIGEEIDVPSCDLILSLDTLEHVFDPYETIDRMVKNKSKYLLLTTAFGIHETAHHTIPMHTNHNVHKVEKYIESKGYVKQKLNIAFPPRFFIRIK